MVGMDVGADQEGVDQGLLVQRIRQVPVGVVVQGRYDFIPGRQVGGAGFCHSEAGVKVVLLELQLQEAVPGGGGKKALLDGAHQVFKSAVGLLQLILQQRQVRVGVSLALIVIGGLGDGLDRLRCEHSLLDGGGDLVLNVFPADVFQPAAGGGFGDPALAGIVVVQALISGSSGDADQRAAAFAAKKFPGQQVDSILAAARHGGIRHNRAAGIFFADSRPLDGVELLLGDNCGDASGYADILVDVDAGIALVGQHPVKG